MFNIMIDEAKRSADYIKEHLKHEIPDTAVILGSGLGKFINLVEVVRFVAYQDIPFFPHTDVVGHAGRLSLAKIDGKKNVLVMEGRFHYYEGYSPAQVAFPIVVMHLLGIKNLIVSNASGGINASFEIGDLMIINDHINFTGNSPLIGKNHQSLGPRFLDQTNPYSARLTKLAKDTANNLNLKYREGVYLGLSGPTYETKAEIRMFSTLGADAVGMSTIFEVIMANYFAMEVLGISSITNLATGISDKAHDHSSVVDVANMVSEHFSNWVKQIILAI